LLLPVEEEEEEEEEEEPALLWAVGLEVGHQKGVL
jgi:hypothetical protein